MVIRKSYDAHEPFPHYRTSTVHSKLDTMTSAPTFTLDRHTVVHLAPDQSASTVPVDENYWAHREAAAELREGRILSVFTHEASWTWWERHPVGSEFVLVLSGAVVFHLQHDDGSGGRSVALAEGECLLVPEGTWHRAGLTAPTTMLFVTPAPALTQHRAA
jgi:mannose-6-phosphate isomerase-like protein (cupin superfamily)